MTEFKKARDAIRQFALTDMDLMNVRDLLYYNMERGLQRETYEQATGSQELNVTFIIYSSSLIMNHSQN